MTHVLAPDAIDLGLDAALPAELECGMAADLRPTRRQLEVLRAWIAAGPIAAAAYQLGISEATARQYLSGLYRRRGCPNAAQAAFMLGQGGGDRRVLGICGSGGDFMTVPRSRPG